jgi:hypothetical protein
VLYPSGERRSGIPNLERRQPDDRHYNRMKRHGLCIQGVIVQTPKNLVAAAMGRGHTLLPAMVLHHLAAGTLFAGHRRISDRAGHCRGQERREQHGQCPEFAKIGHDWQVYSQLHSSHLMHLERKGYTRNARASRSVSPLGSRVWHDSVIPLVFESAECF